MALEKHTATAKEVALKVEVAMESGNGEAELKDPLPWPTWAEVVAADARKKDVAAALKLEVAAASEAAACRAEVAAIREAEVQLWTERAMAAARDFPENFVAAELSVRMEALARIWKTPPGSEPRILRTVQGPSRQGTARGHCDYCHARRCGAPKGY